jgi:leucyl/phenylalanyl-tRNA---protein transferase
MIDKSRPLGRSRFFPPAERAAPEGLVAIGGDLSPERLMDAYRNGIFPWPADDRDPMLWWSPDPRAILPLDRLHVSRRLERTLRSGKFTIRRDSDFAGVISGCATGRGRERGTWLTPAMIAAYTELHKLGHAHCMEAWFEGQLVGGVYGVAVGGAFAAESMFYRERDASKAALVSLVEHLRARGFVLLDIQQWTPHTGRLGAVQIPRREYLQRLAEAQSIDARF